MVIEIDNIPKDKFLKVQEGVLKVLYANGITAKQIETTEIVSGVTDAFLGYEFRIIKEG